MSNDTANGKTIELTDTKTGEKVKWQFSLAIFDYHGVTSDGAGWSPTGRRLREVLQKLKDANTCQIEAVPLHCDYDGLRTSHMGYDSNPCLKVRGRELPELKLVQGHTCGPYVRSYLGNYGSMTDKQREAIADRFGEEFKAAASPELLEELRAEAIKCHTDHYLQSFADLRQRLDKLETEFSTDSETATNEEG